MVTLMWELSTSHGQNAQLACMDWHAHSKLISTGLIWSKIQVSALHIATNLNESRTCGGRNIENEGIPLIKFGT